MPVTLTDEQFTLLCTYLERVNEYSVDPIYVAENIKMSRKLLADVRELAKKQKKTVRHTAARPD